MSKIRSEICDSLGQVSSRESKGKMQTVKDKEDHGALSITSALFLDTNKRKTYIQLIHMQIHNVFMKNSMKITQTKI